MGGRMTIPYIPAQRRDTPVTGAWRAHAACGRADPRLFFPAGAPEAALAQASQAKRVCAGCPVRAVCLDWALTTGREIGVWGGTVPEERRALRAERCALSAVAPGGPRDHQPG
jgi:WhiB family redox-sensing transcriptional regulator